MGNSKLSKTYRYGLKVEQNPTGRHVYIVLI